MPEVIFGVESYTSRSLPLSAQRLVNAFFEKQPHGAKSQTPLFGAPGLTAFQMVPNVAVRNMWIFNGVVYAVVGTSLYSVPKTGAPVAVGTGIVGNGFVSMSDNGKELIIVNGIAGYLYVDTTNTFTQITDPNFRPANTVVFFDGYFILDVIGTNEFQFSGLYDGGTYSALDFATAEAKPGFLLAVAENLEFLFLFCSNHIEYWYDTGANDTPFQRYAGGVIERGIAAPHAYVNQDDAIFFLGQDLIFYRLQGNVPIRVSNHGFEHAMQGYAANNQIADAFCFTYTIEGHKMVHVTFPSVPASWVYDVSTGMLHERDSLDSMANPLMRWRGNCAVAAYGVILIGDAFTGNIWTLDWTNYTEGGNPMRFLAHSAPIHGDKLRLFIDRLELDMETGRGGIDGAAVNPQAMLRWSKDGGLTWSAPQPWRSLGKIGAYLARLRWLSMGCAYQWVFELTVSDAVPRVLIATHLDAKQAMG